MGKAGRDLNLLHKQSWGLSHTTLAMPLFFLPEKPGERGRLKTPDFCGLTNISPFCGSGARLLGQHGGGPRNPPPESNQTGLGALCASILGPALSPGDFPPMPTAAVALVSPRLCSYSTRGRIKSLREGMCVASVPSSASDKTSRNHWLNKDTGTDFSGCF